MPAIRNRQSGVQFPGLDRRLPNLTLQSPRDVTDSMQGFEPCRQGANPCVETLPCVAQQQRHRS